MDGAEESSAVEEGAHLVLNVEHKVEEEDLEVTWMGSERRSSASSSRMRNCEVQEWLRRKEMEKLIVFGRG